MCFVIKAVLSRWHAAECIEYSFISWTVVNIAVAFSQNVFLISVNITVNLTIFFSTTGVIIFLQNIINWLKCNILGFGMHTAQLNMMFYFDRSRNRYSNERGVL